MKLVNESKDKLNPSAFQLSMLLVWVGLVAIHFLLLRLGAGLSYTTYGFLMATMVAIFRATCLMSFVTIQRFAQGPRSAELGHWLWVGFGGVALLSNVLTISRQSHVEFGPIVIVFWLTAFFILFCAHPQRLRKSSWQCWAACLSGSRFPLTYACPFRFSAASP